MPNMIREISWHLIYNLNSLINCLLMVYSLYTIWILKDSFSWKNKANLWTWQKVVFAHLNKYSRVIIQRTQSQSCDRFHILSLANSWEIKEEHTFSLLFLFSSSLHFLFLITFYFLMDRSLENLLVANILR